LKYIRQEQNSGGTLAKIGVAKSFLCALNAPNALNVLNAPNVPNAPNVLNAPNNPNDPNAFSKKPKNLLTPSP